MAWHGVEGEFSCLFNPVYIFNSKTCTWKHGHGCHWYGWKKHHHEGIMWKHVLAFICFSFIYLFVCLITYGITWKHVLAFICFSWIYLFVCLIMFLHFYICNVWFILANNRILVFILKLFLLLSLLC